MVNAVGLVNHLVLFSMAENFLSQFIISVLINSSPVAVSISQAKLFTNY